MNTMKAQKELFKALITNGPRPAIIKCGFDVLYSPQGHNGYVIRDSDFLLDKGKFRSCMNVAGIAPKTDADMLIKPTSAAYIHYNMVIRRFEGDGFAVYINPALLTCFDNPQLYARNQRDRVLVYEKDELVGIVLPIRRQDETLYEKVLQEMADFEEATP